MSKLEVDLPLLLTKLTNDKIKSIAKLCGSPTSGNKSALVESLKLVTSSRMLGINRTIRLISVDLGIKNIGVSEIVIPPWQSAAKPKLERWFRGSLINTAHKFPDLADHAIDFVKNLTADNTIDYFLLEKQRSRTSGSANIPNDVLRVNVMEGMMFTALRLLNTSAELESISPRSIVDFWKFENNAENQKLTVGQAYRMAKKVRQQLVEGWLAKPNDSPLDLNVKQPIDKSKRDDLNDSLVQAYTWIQWRHNCAQLLTNCSDGTDLLTGFFEPIVNV